MKVRVVARNGSTHYLVLPPDVDPVDAVHALTGGSQLGENHWDPGPWLDTEAGGRIRRNVIEHFYVEDERSAESGSTKRSQRLAKKAAAIAATGLVTGAVGVPVHVAQAMIDNSMKPAGGQPTIVLVRGAAPSTGAKERPSDEWEKYGDVDLLGYVRASLESGDESERENGIQILKRLAPLYGLSSKDVLRDPDAALAAIEAKKTATESPLSEFSLLVNPKLTLRGW